MTFEILGVNGKTGEEVRLLTDAKNEEDAKQQVEKIGIFIKKITPTNQSNSKNKASKEEAPKKGFLTSTQKKAFLWVLLGVLVLVTAALLWYNLTLGFLCIFFLTCCGLVYQKRNSPPLNKLAAIGIWFESLPKVAQFGIQGFGGLVVLGAVIAAIGVWKHSATETHNERIKQRVEFEEFAKDSDLRVHFEGAPEDAVSVVALGYAKQMIPPEIAAKKIGVPTFSSDNIISNEQPTEIKTSLFKKFVVSGVVDVVSDAGVKKQSHWEAVVIANVESKNMWPLSVKIDETFVCFNSLAEMRMQMAAE